MLIEGSYKLDSFSMKLAGFILRIGEYWVFGKKTCMKLVHAAIKHMLANYFNLIVNRTSNKGRKNKRNKILSKKFKIQNKWNRIKYKKIHDYVLVNCFDLIVNRTFKWRKKTKK